MQSHVKLKPPFNYEYDWLVLLSYDEGSKCVEGDPAHNVLVIKLDDVFTIR